MGMLHDVVIQSGANIIGYWPTDGYESDASKAEIPGESMFVGLALDEDQQEDMTAERLKQWREQIYAEFALDSLLHEIED